MTVAEKSSRANGDQDEDGGKHNIYQDLFRKLSNKRDDLRNTVLRLEQVWQILLGKIKF